MQALETDNHIPPCSVLLEPAGLSPEDVQGNGTVTVPRGFLRALIAELVAHSPFDEDWYARHYPDVEAARLAGGISSLQDHYKNVGYFEGRLPAEPAFDPHWYRECYRDLAEVFAASDVEGLRRHFLSSGLYEGRAGAPECLAALERWAALAKS
jgi:hypothetical protein